MNKLNRTVFAVMAMLVSFVVCAVFAITSLFSADAQQLPLVPNDEGSGLIYEYDTYLR